MLRDKIHFLFLNILFATLHCFSIELNAQNIGAYTDNRGNLQVFDNGMFRQLEYLPVKDYQFGGKTVAYIDNKNDFRIYQNGTTLTMLNAGEPFSYYVTDYLVSFRVGNVLYAFDNGQKKTLCYYAGFSYVNDSILTYFDESRSTLCAYYNGKLVDLEDSFLDKPKSFSSGANTLAYVNQSNYFNVFYHGELKQLDNVQPLLYEAGRDIVAYVDNYYQQFHLFYYGDTAMVETFAPDSFKVGFANMAYVDQLGNFRIFDKGSTKLIMPDRPEFFQVKGNTIVYYYNNSFNVYYEGKITQLQTWAPKNFQLGNDGVAWIGDNGNVMLFHKGNIITASYEQVNSYVLNGNILKYEVGDNSSVIIFNGKKQ